MSDPEATSVCPILTEGDLSGHLPSLPKVPALDMNSEPGHNKYEGHDCYLEIEGGQEVFYRGTYVRQIQLKTAQLLIGRRDVMAGHYPDVDLAMYRKQDSCISRRHLRIYRDVNGAWFVEDLCSHDATFYNGVALNHERRELNDGDRVIISSSIALVFRVV